MAARDDVRLFPPRHMNEPFAIEPWLSSAIEALEHGDWQRAHELVQHEPGANAAWIHAHLHRIEGDAENAAYWYRRAGRTCAQESLDAERRAIRATLLALDR
jgi:hypothetical protein